MELVSHKKMMLCHMYNSGDKSLILSAFDTLRKRIFPIRAVNAVSEWVSECETGQRATWCRFVPH
jgi:hypothetical protein